ncbi:MAG: phosphatase PAP2 family protein [bacterium]
MSKTKFVSNWRTLLSDTTLRTEFIITLVLLVTTIYFFSRYLLYNELRPGEVIDDPLLKHFSAIDLNFLIFFAIYSSLLIGLVAFAFEPEQLMMAFQTYCLIVFFRILAMYLVPLNPPEGCIDLQDPVVFLLGTGKKIVKDLFFSGHTATAFMLFQVAGNKFLKSYFLIATVVVGISVLLQKAHYTIDVLVGVIFSYASFQIIKSLHKKFYNIEHSKNGYKN